MNHFKLAVLLLALVVGFNQTAIAGGAPQNNVPPMVSDTGQIPNPDGERGVVVRYKGNIVAQGTVSVPDGNAPVTYHYIYGPLSYIGEDGCIETDWHYLGIQNDSTVAWVTVTKIVCPDGTTTWEIKQR